MAEDALAFDVVVQPPPQPRPRSGERLVGQLDVLVVGGDQPRPDQQFDQPLVLDVGRKRYDGGRGCAPVRLPGWASRGAGARHGAVSAAWREPGGTSPRPTGRPRLGSLPSPGSPSTVSVRPSGAATSRAARATARQGPRLSLDLPHQQIDQARLQQQAGLTGRTLDRGSQVRVAHGAQADAARARPAGRSRDSPTARRAGLLAGRRPMAPRSAWRRGR